MPSSPARYPSLYQINTRVWLTELGSSLGRPATLDDIPDTELDRLKGLGFDWVWMLSVWQTGEAGRRVSRSNAEWHPEFQATLPDLTDADIGGSGFAITGYHVSETLGGDPALARLRERLGTRGIRLMLDFVPNHTALDHPWVQEHPEFYVSGTEELLSQFPANYIRVRSANVDRILAHGRDPYFPGWPDTLQLDYGNPATQAAMREELERLSTQCDGVRCDMAMLVLPDVFERTWGRRSEPFWPGVIEAVRRRTPGFRFMAEVYWDLEWTLQQQGFDSTYDKRLYDRLREGQARPVREHLVAGLDFQERLARFLENHDEPRAAAVLPPGQHEAAAVITYLTPGLRFFHQGQLEGRLRRISPHLVRAPVEAPNPVLQEFYQRLLQLLRQAPPRDGAWRLLECSPAWDGNESWDALVAFTWAGPGDSRWLVAVNYAPHPSQGYIRTPFPALRGRAWQLRDLLGEARYERAGDELEDRGLYLDVPPWHAHVFEVTPL